MPLKCLCPEEETPRSLRGVRILASSAVEATISCGSGELFSSEDYGILWIMRCASELYEVYSHGITNGATNGANRKHLSRRSHCVGHAFCSRVSRKKPQQLGKRWWDARDKLLHWEHGIRRFSSCPRNPPAIYRAKCIAPRIIRDVTDILGVRLKKKMNLERIPRISLHCVLSTYWSTLFSKQFVPPLGEV